MNTKLSNLSELANILSVKSEIRANILALFSRFGIGHLLCHMSLEKPQGISAVQLILSFCLFRVGWESIHSIYKKGFRKLLDTGKNCYYRIMTRVSMDWRKLLYGMTVRFQAILRKEQTSDTGLPKCHIIDDTTIEKSGIAMEHISHVFDHHMKGRCVLGYKLLLRAFFDGKTTLPIDFSLHTEKVKSGDYGLTDKQRKARHSKKRDSMQPDYERAKEASRSKFDVAIEMLRRALSHSTLRAQYVLCDCWFTCEKLISEVARIDHGALCFVGLAKIGNTKYKVADKLHCAAELIALHERTGIRECRKYKCLYISLRGTLGDQQVRIFLIKYGHNQSQNVRHAKQSLTSLTFLPLFCFVPLLLTSCLLM